MIHRHSSTKEYKSSSKEQMLPLLKQASRSYISKQFPNALTAYCSAKEGVWVERSVDRVKGSFFSFPPTTRTDVLIVPYETCLRVP